FDLVGFGDAGDRGTAKQPLDFLGVGERSAQADGNVVGEVIAAERYDAGVHDGAFGQHREFGRTGADIGHASTKLALFRTQHGVGAGQAFKDGVVHVNASAVDGGNDVLGGAGGGGHQVDLDLELGSHHAAGLAHAGLVIENEILGKQVQNLAIVGERNGAGALDRLADFIAGDLARARAQADSTLAVQSAHVRAGDAYHGVFNGSAAGVFRLLHCLLHGSDGLLQVHNQSLARAAGFRDAVPAVSQAAVRYLHHQHGSLGASKIDCAQQVVVQFAHGPDCVLRIEFSMSVFPYLSLSVKPLRGSRFCLPDVTGLANSQGVF